MPMNKYGEIIRDPLPRTASTISAASASSASSARASQRSASYTSHPDHSGSIFAIGLGIVILIMAVLSARSVLKPDPVYYYTPPAALDEQDYAPDYDIVPEDYAPDYDIVPEGYDTVPEGYADYTYSAAAEYIIYDSDSRYLTTDDLDVLSTSECRLARNEIYARHGRMFADPSLQYHFSSCSWYVPTTAPEDFDDSVLNQYEKANVEFILQYELARGYN